MSKILTLKRLFIFILLLIAGIIWWSTAKNKNESTLKSVTQENFTNNFELEKKEYDNQISLLNDSIKILNKMITQYKKHINVLTTNSVSIYKKSGNEKIYILPKSDYLDVTEFLSNRYKDSAR